MKRSRFHALDAMRGIAAIVVLLFHAGFISRVPLMPYAYLAVDFFFLLSGFVLGQAYESRLREGLSTVRFLEMRLIRLYPLYLLGLIAGGARACWQIWGGGHYSYNPFGALIAFLANLFMLPAPNSSTSLFPFDYPAWSLFFELFINAIFAWGLWRLRSTWLSAFCAAAGLLLFLVLLESGTADLGVGWPTFTGGLLRVCFSFPLGVLMARCFRRPPEIKYRALLPIFLLFAYLSAPVAGGNLSYDIAGIYLFLPLLLWIGAHWDVPKRFEPACAVLGDISYPLYVLHYPLLQGLMNIFVRRMGFEPVWSALAFALLLSGFCWVVARYLDAPVRLWLSKRARLRATAIPAIS